MITTHSPGSRIDSLVTICTSWSECTIVNLTTTIMGGKQQGLLPWNHISTWGDTGRQLMLCVTSENNIQTYVVTYVYLKYIIYMYYMYVCFLNKIIYLSIYLLRSLARMRNKLLTNQRRDIKTQGEHNRDGFIPCLMWSDIFSLSHYKIK